MLRRVRLFVVASAALVLAAAALAQNFGFRGESRGRFHTMPNAPYDGRFAFVRVNYQTAPGGYWYRGWPAWAHGYPIAEQNLMRIMNEVTLLGAHDDQVDTMPLDDPEIFHYPVIYIIEVGWWTLTESEASALRAYLQKGGFVIVDDFKVQGFDGGFGNGGGGWPVFEANMNRVLPGVKFFEMDASHPIYHCFFEIPSLEIVPQAYNAGKPVFRGVYEDNDPSKRLMMIVNYNTDISQFWEWSGTGLRPIDDTNEAYKLGVNYVMYGLTH